MESVEPVEPVKDPLPVAHVVERDHDLRSRAQKACDKLPSCNSNWCDIGGCDAPCEAFELLSVLEGCDVGCG
jgi:hypothetical protein